MLTFFHESGIPHPDDMTSILFSATWHHVNDNPYDLAAIIYKFREYRKDQGFANGKPDINTI